MQIKSYISSFRNLILGLLGLVWLCIASAGPVPVPHHAGSTVYHHILKEVGDEPHTDLQDDYSHIVKNSRSRLQKTVYRKRIIHAQSPALFFTNVAALLRPYYGAGAHLCGGAARVFIRPGYYVHLFRCAVF